MTVRMIATAILIFLLSGVPSASQSTVDLLQKGIYMQETVGDIDGAIRIYRQVLASASKTRTDAAQAQYRLALCLRRKGDNAEAKKAFGELIQAYPEEKVLVAKARQYVSDEMNLLPIPWANNELSEYRLKYPGGLVSGTLVKSVRPSTVYPHAIMFESRYYLGATNNLSRAEVHSDTMEVVSETDSSTIFGDSRTDYSNRQARLQLEGEALKTIELDGPIFSFEELPFLFRRLPLAPGYKTTLSVMNQLDVPTKLELTVLGIEEVQVPAGAFHCFKLQLGAIKQIFWIEADARRLFVRVDTNGIIGELVDVRKVDLLSSVDYRDSKVGLAFTALPGWIVQPQNVPAKDETRASMLDPEAKAIILISASATTTNKLEMAQQLRASLDEKIKQRSETVQGYRVRPDSIRLGQIGENQWLSCVADYVQGERKMVNYLNLVRSENTNAQFFAIVPAPDFGEFRKRFDLILETVKLK